MDNKKFLEQSAGDYHDNILKGWEDLYEEKRQRLFHTMSQYHRPGIALEMGSADGIMTQKLCGEFESLTVVDGSQLFLDQLKEKVVADNIKVDCALFEEYNSEVKFNNIFMTHILEHLDDPILVLKRSLDWLADDGYVFIAVPNANSLHRYVGVEMGMLEKRDSLNDQDVLLGHRRVYTPDLLKSHVESAGYKIEKFGGQMVKPLSNRQIQDQWSPELISAFFGLSDKLPELCSEIFIIASKA